MQTIRTFIAIALPDDVRRACGRMKDQLEDAIPGVKWVDTENLHITLKFLGDVDNREVPDVCRVARQTCQPFKPFLLDLGGAGAFPNVDNPRVIWAGVTDIDEQLCPLADQLDQQMGTLGIKREFRSYQPHLTLGRIKKSGAGKYTPEAVQTCNDIELGSFQVTELIVYASYLEAAGPSYQVMDRIGL